MILHRVKTTKKKKTKVMAKHTPFTSEMSKPHTSDAHPEVHVDCIHYGADGKQDSRLCVDGITDKGSISLGQDTYDHHQASKSGGSNSGSNGNSGGSSSDNDRSSSSSGGDSGK